ncbi:hypothetical protein Ancab_019189 [Ancistrocladus abbreviatus]
MIQWASLLGYEPTSTLFRKFTVMHLAQVKHTLPEAVVIHKTRVQDEQTNCMKKQLSVTMDAEAIKDIQNVNDAKTPLKKIFHARIIQCYETHPEVMTFQEEALPQTYYPPSHIPEEVLPQLFYPLSYIPEGNHGRNLLSINNITLFFNIL